MEYRLLALDLDGSLLEPDLSVLPQTANSIARLMRSGVIVTLATGRAFPSAKKYADMLGIDCPLICYNGAVIKNTAGQILYESFLPPQLVRAVAAACEAHRWYLQLYSDDRIAVERVTAHTENDPDYQNMPTVEVGPLSEAKLGPTPKMLTRCAPGESERRAEALRRISGGGLYITDSSPGTVEMMSREAGKAAALARLCGSLCIDLTRTVVCGDGGNDLDMIKAAGLGCATANAAPEVKESADYVCTGNNGHGVFEVINKFFPAQ